MNCPAVVQYKVIFSDGTVLYPKLPGSANVYAVAFDYAKSKGIKVISISWL
ncbi:MAG: hypothetical protein GX638_10695 [Crenarchaeota archaeon]|nr:hypothetical protein [Thermoproteota archaeon]